MRSQAQPPVLPSPFRTAGEHISVELPGARVVFTTRRGGRSQGPYESLNLGLLTADDRELVAANRRLLAAALGVEFAYGRQVHGDQVSVATQPTVPGGELLDADGQATAAAGLAPLVLTADCLPIALAAPGAVAMVHAGWRGLAGGVIAAGVRALRELARPGPIHAAIGPGAGVCCYEAGEEVHEALREWGPDVRRDRHADLKLAARRQLRASGVGAVQDVALCTICSGAEWFFSHRRDGPVTGRQAGVAWLS